MLLRMTRTHVPTSARTAAHTRGWPARAKAIMASLVTMERAMFWITFHLACLEILTTFGMFRMSLDMRTTWPVCVASADPEIPIEIPTSAVARAGASFMPSPTMPTAPSFLNSVTSLALSSGRSSAWTASMASPICIKIELTIFLKIN